jgi:pilus assembly protein CpaD
LASRPASPINAANGQETLPWAAAAADWSNKPYWNFGCAYQTALAAQIADPRDLVAPQAETPADTAMRVRAIENLRKGEDPGTNWKLTNSSISQVGTN